MGGLTAPAEDSDRLSNRPDVVKAVIVPLPACLDARQQRRPRLVAPFIIKNRPPACSRCRPLIMDKFLLQQQVLERLAQDLLQAEQAVRAAHETATHEENIAENKYDTLGLEAAYLATGQARRAEAIRQAMAHWRQFRPRPYDASKGIQLGALVCLVDADDKQQQLFLGPDGGSMKLVSGDQLVQVISCESPLGRAMLGKCEGDEVSIQVAPIRQQFEVLRVH
jgi:transcription elongation GreA/GreB family factor